MIRLATIKIWLPALVVLGLLAFLMMLLAGAAAVQPAATGASDVALSDIPPNYYALYVKAGTDYKTDWWVLAAIGKVETNHGRSKLPGVSSGVNAYGCCAGPMQFAVSEAAGCRACVGDTWGAYAVDGNGDGARSVYDPADAIPAAARYTNANGAPREWKRALWHYNRSQAYYLEVMEWAKRYRAVIPTSGAGVPVGSVTAQALVNHPNIHFWHSCQKTDLLTGQIDPRLMAALATIASNQRIGIYALKCDHSSYTVVGTLSNHGQGRAADISDVGGEVCRGATSGKCGLLATAFSRRRDALTPTESIYCFDPDPTDGRRWSWGQSDHCDHWHLGYDATS